jgi:Flp pilus assembly protein TadG
MSGAAGGGPMAPAGGRWARRRAPADGRGGARPGQALVELALVSAVVLTLMVGLVQVTLYLHAQGVVNGACQEGARVASAGPEDRLADGVAYADDLVRAGLGPSAARVAVTGSTDGATVTLEASGSLPMILPWFGDRLLPLSARVVVEKERFRVAR